MAHIHAILDQAQEVSNTLTEYKRYDKAERELQALKGERGRPNLTLQLLVMQTREDSDQLLDQAINVANGRLDELASDLDRKLRYD